jgi:hypothetical protein
MPLEPGAFKVADSVETTRLNAVKTHVLAVAELIGTYQR